MGWGSWIAGTLHEKGNTGTRRLSCCEIRRCGASAGYRIAVAAQFGLPILAARVNEDAHVLPPSILQS